MPAIWRCVLVGMLSLLWSRDVLLAQPEDISADLKTLAAKHNVPAMGIAIVIDGEIQAVGATGIRRRGSSEPVTTEDKWHVGSCTKAFTATLAALAVREGLISWDSTVEDVFRSQRVQIHPEFRSATLRQLLSNTAGCPEDVPETLWQTLWKNRGTARAQRMQLVRGLLKYAPASPPGTKYEYSNAGFAIAGAMLEVVCNQPYETLVQERVFKPLGMTSAGFRAPGIKGRVDQPYGHNPDPVDPEPQGDNPRGIAPSGAIHCSITDWAKFAQLHLGTSPSNLLTAEELDFLHQVVDEKEGYALGWYRFDRGWARGPALNHNGSNTMWYCCIWLAPAMKYGVVVTTNIGGDEGFKACDDAARWSINRLSR
ncbi:MAG: beta-lactamase family protein [Planctomycetaceae bacterium]|nr:beta-lactamase family protein [Planctomycetaceae bacterium]